MGGHALRTRERKIPGGGERGGRETREAFHKRIADVAERIADMQGREVLAISHGMVWQALHDLHSAEQTPWIGNADVYRVTLESSTILSEHVYRQEKEE